jgi:hypothetical protein
VRLREARCVSLADARAKRPARPAVPSQPMCRVIRWFDPVCT